MDKPKLILLCGLSLLLSITVQAADRPNIVWITAEDMSPTLGCYGDNYATTPHIDRFASQSVRYTHAFATAPVCSPARSCLITGCYATSLGTFQMRSAFPIPESIRGFPEFLRSRGFYTSNNVKTDYNFANSQSIIADAWDESSDSAHWRNRNEQNKPFFAVFNLMTSHQSRSMQWSQQRFRDEIQSQLARGQIHDSAMAPLPPYYPDTMTVRRTVARFYDCVTAMDAQVGGILEQLEQDGLADDTIVFFYSDHGSGLPRHKRVLLDSGMHVPLLIRFPEKFAHLAPARPGESVDRIVSFVDFAPTVLSLVNSDIPKYMQGKPFLGEKSAVERTYAFGHRDRIDESVDTARSVRDKRYLYIRNHMPHFGYSERSWWPDQGEINQDLYRIANQRHELSTAQHHFLSNGRATEELYDCETDPHNTTNLADSADHQAIINRLRTVNFEHLVETRDLGFIPEPLLWDLTEGSTPWEYARSDQVSDNEFRRLIDAAMDVGQANENELAESLTDPNPSVRYWAAIGFAERKTLQTSEPLLKALTDPTPAVRIAAAAALGRHGFLEMALPVLVAATKNDDLTVVLYATRAIESLGNRARSIAPAIKSVAERAKALLQQPTDGATFVLSKEQDLAMFCGFSADAFLTNLGQGDWIELFDGETLAGWTAMSNGQVSAKNGEIQLLSRENNLWLIHEKQFGDFELIAEVKMPTDSYNSGIAFRCSDTGKNRPTGYQCEIAESDSGMLYGIGKGWIWPRSDTEKREFREKSANAFESGNWNQIRIVCRGMNIRIWVNGIQSVDVVDSSFQKGSIAIQHHGKGGVHRFRNIAIRKIQNGKEIP